MLLATRPLRAVDAVLELLQALAGAGEQVGGHLTLVAEYSMWKVLTWKPVGRECTWPGKRRGAVRTIRISSVHWRWSALCAVVALSACSYDEAAGDCEAGSFRPALDAMCKPVTECAAGEYETTAPTRTTDRVCTHMLVCSAEEYETTAPTAKHRAVATVI